MGLDPLPKPLQDALNTLGIYTPPKPSEPPQTRFLPVWRPTKDQTEPPFQENTMKTYALAYAKYHARDLEGNLSAAYWTEDNFHIERSRDALCRLLTEGGKKDHLIDLIANAMNDVHDMDVTMYDYARAVADAIINTAIPTEE